MHQVYKGDIRIFDCLSGIALLTRASRATNPVSIESAVAGQWSYVLRVVTTRLVAGASCEASAELKSAVISQ